MEKSQPIVIIAENTTTQWSSEVVLFSSVLEDYGNTGGEIQEKELIYQNDSQLSRKQSATYFYNRPYVTFGLSDGGATFVEGNKFISKVGLSDGISDTEQIVQKIQVTSYSYWSGQYNAIGNLSFLNDTLEDNGMDYAMFFAPIGSGVCFLIYREEKYPTDVNFVEFYHVTAEGSIVQLSSGVPNVTLSKIYANILGGDIFKMGKLRIECISGTADITEPISYRLQTSEGDMIENPIYPNISVIQQVDSVIDVDLDGLLINSDGFFKIATIPPNTKIRYSFYPKEQGNPTITFKRADLDKELIIPDLNKIDGISQEKVSDIQSQKTDTKNPNKTTADKNGNDKECGWLWVLALGFGIFATYKLIKD